MYVETLTTTVQRNSELNSIFSLFSQDGRTKSGRKERTFTDGHHRYWCWVWWSSSPAVGDRPFHYHSQTKGRRQAGSK